MPQTIHLTNHGWRLYQRLRMWLAARGIFEERSEEEFIAHQVDQSPNADRYAACLNCSQMRRLLGEDGYYCNTCVRGAVEK